MRNLMRAFSASSILVVFVATLALGVEAKPDDRNLLTNKRLEASVLDNDDLQDGKKIVEISEALNGEASVSSDQTKIIYQPDDNFIGVERIIYKATDDRGSQVESALNVSIRGVVDGISADQLADASIVLLQALILALVLEAGVHLIFSYQWFIYFCEGRGFKVPTMIVMALILVGAFDFDLVQRLLAIFSNPDPEMHLISKFLSGLIIAGGTSTIYVLYRTLGLRPPASERDGSAFRRAEFSRVQFDITRGGPGSLSEKATLEVFIDGKLYGTIANNQSVFPVSRIRSLPVQVGAKEFKIAVSSDFSGTKNWTRSLEIGRLESVKMHFDLSKDPPTYLRSQDKATVRR